MITVSQIEADIDLARSKMKDCMENNSPVGAREWTEVISLLLHIRESAINNTEDAE